MTKVAVAMSGGVDSSVAAALAVDKYGRENVFGLTMKLYCYGDDDASEKSCCSLDAITDAVSVCMRLGIRHYVVNLEKEFRAEVIDNFISEYEQGNTPNPCIRCNSLIKFRHLLSKSQELGADMLVTGHYSRIEKTKDTFHLLRGLDKTKDQSYFLYGLGQDQLSHIWFPLGEMTKTETRKLAEKYGLKTAQKTESQDVCFISSTTQEFLAGKVKAASGNIIDKEGKVLGRHEGLPFYTIGQRKGLGGGFTEPMYVVGVNLENNELIVGREEDLYADEMTVKGVTWTNVAPDFPAELEVKIRYNSEATSASLRGTEGDAAISIKFHKPQKAITPGQTAVFYSGDEVIGGGTILST